MLCEKPLTLNARLTAQCIAAARDHKTFFMEAMWTRCQPIYRTIRRWLASGAIGELRAMRGDFSISVPYDPKERHYDPQQGGGALLDLGIYPLMMAQWLFPEEPMAITSSHHLAPSGVDESFTVTMRYHRGREATFSAALNAVGTHSMDILGSTGRIHVPGAWWASEAQLYRGYEQAEHVKVDDGLHGFVYEIRHVESCLAKGLRESPLVPLADSLRALPVRWMLCVRVGVFSIRRMFYKRQS